MTQAWRVRPARAADRAAWATLRAALWPQANPADHPADIERLLDHPQRMVAFLAIDPADESIGFAEATVRSDFVNGTDTSPVGFLEGLYVVPDWRRRGVGRALVAAVEQWTRERDCRELASDAYLDNRDSHDAHVAYGFEETERVVYFRKRLG